MYKHHIEVKKSFQTSKAPQKSEFSAQLQLKLRATSAFLCELISQEVSWVGI